MNNYFFGLNKTSHLYHNSKVVEKSPLFQNNYDHVRFIRSVGQTSFNFANYANKDAATNNKNISDSQTLSLSGSESAETKLRKIQEIAGPDAKIDTETLNKIYSGQDVNVTLNKLEGEHRNLFIGLGTLVAQLIGGASGAAFNPELSGAISDRFKGDVEFLKRNGNEYGLNLFGRASTGGVEISAAIIPQEEAPKKVFNDNLLLQQLEQAKKKRETQKVEVDPKTGLPVVDSVGAAKEYRQLSVENHEDTSVSGGKVSIEEAARRELINRYGANIFSDGRGTRGNGTTTVSSIFILGDRDGYQVQRDPKDPKSKAVRPDVGGLEYGKDYQNVRNAASEFVSLADSAGLLEEGISKRTDLNSEQKAQLLKDLRAAIANPTAANGEKLAQAFDLVETVLKDRYGNTDDNLLGGQHITNLQKALNDKIKETTDGASALTRIAAGGSVTPEELELAAKVFNKGNNLTGTGREISGTDLLKQLQSGNFTGVSQALNTAVTDVQALANTIKSQAGGLYSRNNEILGNTLNAVKDGGVFEQQVQQFNVALAGARRGVDGGQSIAQQANNTAGLIDPTKQVNQASANSALEELGGKLRTQLLANGVASINGQQLTGSNAISDAQIAQIAKGFTGENPQNITLGLANGKEKILTPTQQEQQGKGLVSRIIGQFSDENTIRNNFKAVGELGKKIDTAGTTTTGGQDLTRSIKTDAERVSSGLVEGKAIEEASANTALNSFAQRLGTQLTANGVTSIQIGDDTISGKDLQDPKKLLEIAQRVSAGQQLTIPTQNASGQPQTIDSDTAKSIEANFKAVGELQTRIQNIGTISATGEDSKATTSFSVDGKEVSGRDEAIKALEANLQKTNAFIGRNQGFLEQAEPQKLLQTAVATLKSQFAQFGLVPGENGKIDEVKAGELGLGAAAREFNKIQFSADASRIVGNSQPVSDAKKLATVQTVTSTSSEPNTSTVPTSSTPQTEQVKPTSTTPLQDAQKVGKVGEVLTGQSSSGNPTVPTSTQATLDTFKDFKAEKTPDYTKFLDENKNAGYVDDKKKENFLTMLGDTVKQFTDLFTVEFIRMADNLLKQLGQTLGSYKYGFGSNGQGTDVGISTSDYTPDKQGASTSTRGILQTYEFANAVGTGARVGQEAGSGLQVPRSQDGRNEVLGGIEGGYNSFKQYDRNRRQEAAKAGTTFRLGDTEGIQKAFDKSIQKGLSFSTQEDSNNLARVNSSIKPIEDKLEGIRKLERLAELNSLNATGNITQEQSKELGKLKSEEGGIKTSLEVKDTSQTTLNDLKTSLEKDLKPLKAQRDILERAVFLSQQSGSAGTELSQFAALIEKSKQAQRNNSSLSVEDNAELVRLSIQLEGKVDFILKQARRTGTPISDDVQRGIDAFVGNKDKIGLRDEGKLAQAQLQNTLVGDALKTIGSRTSVSKTELDQLNKIADFANNRIQDLKGRGLGNTQEFKDLLKSYEEQRKRISDLKLDANSNSDPKTLKALDEVFGAAKSVSVDVEVKGVIAGNQANKQNGSSSGQQRQSTPVAQLQGVNYSDRGSDAQTSTSPDEIPTFAPVVQQETGAPNVTRGEGEDLVSNNSNNDGQTLNNGV